MVSSGPSAAPLQPIQPMMGLIPNNNAEKSAVPKDVPVGSTWKNSGNLNIDFDNLLNTKPKQGPSPSMNQMVSNPTSPVNQPRILSPQSNMTPTALNFNNTTTPQTMFPQNNQQFFGAFK